MALATVARVLSVAFVGALTALATMSPAHANPKVGGGEEPAPAAEVPAIPGPVQFDPGVATVYAKRHPGSVPAGVNNFHCKPSAKHPNPVVLVHGSDGSSYSSWAGLAPLLVQDHYCVFALNYGGKPGATQFGNWSMDLSGHQLAAFVNHVRAVTHARRVDLVGFSQGATVSRYYIKRLGGAAKVHQWIGLASPTYGGVFYGLVPLVQANPDLLPLVNLFTSTAVIEQMQDSPFLNALNADGDTAPGVHYTTIGSKVDEMIQPYTNVALHSPGATNILIQDLCPVDMTGHFNMPYDHFAQQLVLQALDPTTTETPLCQPVPLGTGILSVVLSADR